MSTKRFLSVAGYAKKAARFAGCNLAAFTFLAGAAPAIGTLLPTSHALAAISPQQASQFMQEFGNKLLTVINSDEPLSQKQARMAPLLFSNVDVDAIGRYCLGRYWNVATPEQRTRFLKLFHQVLLNAVNGKIGDFKGVNFTIGKVSSNADGDTVVETVVIRPGQPQASVHWIISSESGRPQVIDLIGEGASLRLTQRNDYSSYIAHNGNNVENLLGAMQRQIERNAHPAGEQ
ncbi:MlaC/ttg2D family ABC transporter substrate-binding protein [Entomobacter blattae]|uniref:MlaC protein n=1 Tax=Entomobacter blattae TaxID=2762277 RepID=A0A7H1NR04_9PROT|nr:ABC transporter substrate-binding protein [Entomobacter blattae]QNT78214.1 MlaC protein [Entomobacter blattae]